MNKLRVNFIIGHKSEIYIADQTPTGERRIYDNDFWEIMNRQIDPNFIHLYKPFALNLPFTQSLTNIAYHFNNARTVKKLADPNAISHIFFEEESALLRLLHLKKAVVTCLDIIPIAFPQDISWHYRTFYKSCVKGLKKADKILTVSEHTKKDLVKYLNIPPHKITTAYWGINKIFKPQKPDADFFKKYNFNPHKKYLLGVGGLHIARKNMRLLIEILPKLLREFPDLELIIAGYNKDSSPAALQKFIAKENLQTKIHLLTKVPDQDLCYLYNLASVFVFPSLYEGFGLPPAEAMSCGTPVVASNNSSLPEAVGDAGVLINPRNPAEIINAISRLLTDDHLRHALIEKGFAHIKKFTWQKYANDLYKTYEELS
jgi:glycosyltransferase involved in cell wall biosynthesis